jgi:uncharacterized membrane protein YcaP (DUF421 family)
MNFIWESIVLVIAGFLLLRLAGRKSIAQMSISTTVVMISIGSIIVQPIVETKVWKTVGATAIFIAVLVLVEYLEMKFNIFEKFMTGKSKMVISNGNLEVKTLRKLRLTVDKLEMLLRQQGITKISDVKSATIEANGQLGYELMPDAKPLTVGEFTKLMSQFQLKEMPTPPGFTIFEEVKDGEHPIPNEKSLQ